MSAPLNPEPVTIRVSVFAPGRWKGGGKLIISPGSLQCISGRFIAKLSKVHQVRIDGSRIDIYRGPQPWGSLTIPIRESGDVLVARVFPLGKATFRRALRAAGFDVVEHISWIHRGFRLSELKSKGRSLK